MTAEFNPYLEWLHIPLSDQPPNYYSLLGIAFQESDPDVIVAAADSRMAKVRSVQSGPRGQYTKALLNELSQAKLCLLDPQEKWKYDSQFGGASMLPDAAASDIPRQLEVKTDSAATNVNFAPAISTGEAEKVIMDGAPVKSEEKDVQSGKRYIKVPLYVFAGFWVLTIAIGVWGLGRFFMSLGQKERDAQIRRQQESDKLAIEAKKKPTKPVMVGTFVSTDSSNNYLLLPKNALKLKGSVSREMIAGEPALTDWKETDEALWQVKVKVPSSFKAEITYLANNVGEESKLIFYAEDRKKVLFLRETGENEFVTYTFYVFFPKEMDIVTRLVAKDVSGDIAVRSIRIFPRTR